MKPQILGWNRAKIYVWVALISLIFMSCKDKNNGTGPGEETTTVLEMIEANSSINIFAELVAGTALESILSGSSPVTVFAPSNGALAQLPEGYLAGLSNEQLLDFLKYHIYSGNYPIINEIKKESIASLHGDPLFLEIGQPNVDEDLINGIGISVTNIQAYNGRIHIIDGLLVPDQYGTLADNLKKRYDYRKMYQRMEEAGNKIMLVTTDAGFIPIEEAGDWTAEQWTEIMRHQLLVQDFTGFGPGTRMGLITLSGDSLFLTIDEPGKYNLNESSVDPLLIVNATNGKMISSPGIMLPDRYLDILTLMSKRYYVRTTRSALATARMTGRLYNSDRNADEQFTLFTPSNNAAGINTWPTGETELANILQYHVLLEKVTADQLQDGQIYTTWQGEELTIQRTGNVITINGTATITLADLEGTNGVVHVINGTLTPPVN